MESQSDRVTILLATFNGEKFLNEQLSSFVEQIDDQWDLLVSDDGSSDDTVELIRTFKRQVKQDHEVTIVTGPKGGFAANFLSLLVRVPSTAELVAFSDQDDVWFPEKISRGRASIADVQDKQIPVLYAAGSVICNEELQLVGESSNFSKHPSFGNSLVQSIGAGNTMMLNGPAIRLLQSAAQEVDALVAHDWWVYQMISGCGGVVVRDPAPTLYYRQHLNNLIGTNRTLRGKASRLFFVTGGKFADWNDTNIRNLNATQHKLTPKAKESLAQFSNARKGSAIKRIRALYRSGAARQRTIGTIALYLACLANRL
ncbi:Glycosyl transferase family 2 [Octadecabacter temperatus]|uniref:UDP-Glc:alpha-D-GlcNAc-diphosphoundecaprenol beta-1,3-glucosyltransferase WfgD n=1 Tax=Octadecabacter temperatus TaxID=1458307 RepID=A0A0K0YA97_9RHOB|nr:glycosyltransferase [Octadecabacter temperatus]AKS47850.1 UDP-Glc:alpha-D-GlcNAc-diphosphoundecaprenol beta-1,3-glucosyltransferase WfgD [Octadecabacter temperatus]SIO48342.1 Glycosyl transferase family 2 [Octadecabacter temperatus]